MSADNENRILTELPKWDKGTNKGKTDCRSMVGMELAIYYEGEKYTVKIVDYIKERRPKFLIRYKENEKEIPCSDFISGRKFGGILFDYKEVCLGSKNRIINKLPFKGDSIDFKSMVGMTLELIYESNLYSVKVIEYKKGGKLIIDYEGYKTEVFASNFIYKSKFGNVLKKYTKDFKIEIGKVFKDDKRNMVITDREYYKDDKGIRRKRYKYKCNKCKHATGDNYEGWIEESNLLKGNGCACCTGKVVVGDINSIWATDRWMCDLGLSEQDAKKYMRSSNNRVVVVCPNCKKQKETVISSINTSRSISCICEGKTSYPEMFMFDVLNQLGAEFKYQLTKTTFDWCGDKRYDFYLCKDNSIIETHGRQHYEEAKNFKRTLEEEQANDKYKHELALRNGIKNENYIIIDCRYSNLEWIKNSILNSELNKLYDLSKVDWDKAHKFAKTTKIKIEVCKYWNNKEEWETTKDLAKYFDRSQKTIRSYLRSGTELGLCNYIGRKQTKINYLK